MKNTPQCAVCPIPMAEKACMRERGKAPAGCPTLAAHKNIRTWFSDSEPEELRMAANALRQEYAAFSKVNGVNTPVKPRIVEIVEFCKRQGYTHLGLVFCGGSRAEGKIVDEILRVNGFEVTSVICKVGRIPKADFNDRPECPFPAGVGAASACNPKAQAMLVNEAGVEFNILLNLCVGHDTIAIKHLEAPVTVLSVKDRVLGHNPLAALYTRDSLHSYLKQPLPLPGE